MSWAVRENLLPVHGPQDEYPQQREHRVRWGSRLLAQAGQGMSAQALLDIGFAHDRTTGKEDWLTPPEIIKSLGSFDLDPCSPMPRPWDTAAKHYTLADNGLRQPWEGRVWMNPPYGNESSKWMERLAHHGNGIALIFARTETATFFPWVWEHASSILFIKGRINFYTKEGRRGGTAGAPSVLIGYGGGNTAALEQCGIKGHLVRLRD